MSEPFSDMDEKSRVFYQRVFANAMLNLHAVRMGYFDMLLCETDDPRVNTRWQATLPHLAKIMRAKRNLRNNYGH